MTTLTMHRLKTIQQAREFVYENRFHGRTIGLVPTMGALHDGHLSLARHSISQCDVTIATIFLNPTQFAEGEDLENYPRTLQADCEALQAIGADAVFVPSRSEMYVDGYSTFVDPPDVAKRWEGEFRPTHFRGVATVVLKLFHALPATHAFFGRKDYQQLQVIEAIVRDLNVGIEIVGCETVRESDGLAMSSRNRYLDPAERERALNLSRSLQDVAIAVHKGTTDSQALQSLLHQQLLGSGGFANRPNGVDRVDYAVIVDPVTLEPMLTVDRPAIALVACHIGRTRLIDNLLITP